MKIAIITCYKQPDYVRARTLRAALAAVPNTEVLVIKNAHQGWLRFIEVPLKILKARWRDHPDAWLITFRGYEMLVFMVLTRTHQPIIFDEFINFTEWMEEHRRLRPRTAPYRLFRRWYAWLAGHCRLILADTAAHARYSAHLNRLPGQRYRVIPVGTDETIFKPRKAELPAGRPFTVFYYGKMLPLHGLDYVLEAAQLLKERPEINFYFVGGGRSAAKACAMAAANGAHVRYDAWLPFEQLPVAASGAGLTLGGPFGDTLQAQFVITGKTYQFLALGAPVLIGHNQAAAAFEDRINCLMVPLGNAEAIAEFITWAHSHPDELQHIGQAGRQLYETKFSQAVINKLTKQLLNDLA